MEYDYMTRTLQDTLCTIYISSLWIWFIVSETQSLVWPDNKFRGTHSSHWQNHTHQTCLCTWTSLRTFRLSHTCRCYMGWTSSNSSLSQYMYIQLSICTYNLVHVKYILHLLLYTIYRLNTNRLGNLQIYYTLIAGTQKPLGLPASWWNFICWFLTPELKIILTELTKKTCAVLYLLWSLSNHSYQCSNANP